MSDGNVDYRRANAVCASVTKEADSNQPGGKCHLRPSPGHASYFKRNTRTIRLCIRVFHKSDFYQGGVMKKLISFVVGLLVSAFIMAAGMADSEEAPVKVISASGK